MHEATSTHEATRAHRAATAYEAMTTHGATGLPQVAGRGTCEFSLHKPTDGQVQSRDDVQNYGDVRSYIWNYSTTRGRDNTSQ